MGWAAGEQAFKPEDDLIFDIGMNICEDTKFYLAKGFRVVAIDANPFTCHNAQAAFEPEIKSGRLTIINKAISDREGETLFFVCKEMSAWSTASEELRDSWAKSGVSFDEVRVEAVPIQNIV